MCQIHIVVVREGEGRALTVIGSNDLEPSLLLTSMSVWREKLHGDFKSSDVISEPLMGMIV